MKLTNTPTITGNQAELTFNDFSLASYLDYIAIRGLPTYKVIDNTITFPANHVDGFYQERIKLPLSVTEKLFDYQQVIAKVSFIKGCYGIFLDPGLGKTYALGEVARQVHAAYPERKILYITALNILTQSQEMCQTFFDDFPASVNLHNSKRTLKEWALLDDESVAFINHEAFIKIDELPRNIELVLLDEASILKGGQGGNGKIARNLISACKFVPRRIAASGTPAPNDKTEYAMICWWLGYINSEKEFYSMYFVNKDGEYVLRRHATEKFYQYLASWSIFMRSPASYGFDNNLRDLKPWKEIHILVDMTPEQDDLIKKWAKKGKQAYLPGIAVPPSDMGQRSKFSQISKGFVYNGDEATSYVTSNKPQAIHDIIVSHAGKQVIVWTVFDEEGDILERKLLSEGYRVAHITGKTKPETRLSQIDQFRHGELDVIISKPRILGFGLNFQFCFIEIFSGLQDSFEQYFQAVKRVHRYGQMEQVLIYLVYTAYEEVIIQNVLKKQKSMQQDFDYQERLYIGSLADELKDFLLLEDFAPMSEFESVKYEPIITRDYSLYHADSIKSMLMIREIYLATDKPAKARELARQENMSYETLWGMYDSLIDKVDLSVFSPPFPGDVFTYSRDPADMGNTRGAGAVGGMDDFMLQFQFFLEGMKTVTKPGRIMAMHLEDVPLRKGLDGNVGLFDVTGEVTRAAAKAGWVLVGKIPIIKNQQMQSIVKHVSNLAMGNMEKDRLRIAPAMNGTMLLFKKPGESDRAVADLATCKSCGWQGYASSLIGYDSKTTRNYKSGEINAMSLDQCPKCEGLEVEIYSEMYGDKWILYAEGAWPDKGFDSDFGKLAKMPREERWLNMVQTALGIWFDVQEGETLGLDRSKNFHDTEDADKHLCPLPLVVIQRPIEMYTLPGELVFTPFSGSGTCLDRAIRTGRKVVAMELKPEYFVLSNSNAEKALAESKQLTLFDLEALKV
jgi:hypothetical protein